MSGIYNRFLNNLMTKQVDLVNDTVKVALMNNSHSFVGTDNEWADVSANEITGVGYTAGGEEITGKGVTQGATTVWDADNVMWYDAQFSAYHAVIYDDTLANKDLICSIDFGGEYAINDGYFEIEWSGNGIITLSEV